RSVNYVRAAAIKAYLLRKYRYQSHNPFEVILTMALNEQSTVPAYLLGRLFAVLDIAQKDAEDAKATIKRPPFPSACASPASIIPVLLRLSQQQHSRINADTPGTARFLDAHIHHIQTRPAVQQHPSPARLTRDEQGVFILSYSHQRADIYT